MDDLAAQFEANRSHLRAVAYRMLGSVAEADDAVQETWLRLSRADAGVVVPPRGRTFAVAGFTVAGGRIAAIDLLLDPARLRELDLTVLGE